MASQPLLLSLLASPRPSGVSARLLNAFASHARGYRIQKIFLPALQVLPCRACPQCRAARRGRSASELARLFALFDRASALVLSTPVYFYGFPAAAKAVIDSCQPLWRDPYWRRRPKRPAYFLANCAAYRRDEFAVIVREAKAFLNTIGFYCAGQLLVPGMDRKDAPRLLRAALKKAAALSRRLPSLKSGQP